MNKDSISILISAGEPSGDLLASEVVNSFGKLNPAISCFGMTGPLMVSSGVEKIADMPSVMGFGSPVKNAGAILKSIHSLVTAAVARKPKAALLVDFPDFHMIFARMLKKARIPVFQYISPQFWAWRKSRIHTIKKLYEKTFVVLPFEEKLYLENGAHVEYVGHPAVNRVNTAPSRLEARKRLEIVPGTTVVAMLPGSRTNEVERLMPLFIETAIEIHKSHTEAKFLISAKNPVVFDIFSRYPKEITGYVTASSEEGLVIMKAADAGIVCSGTATLEAAVAGLPFLGVYKTSNLNYMIGKTLLKIDKILLANIILGRKAINEYIQMDAIPNSLAAETLRLLKDGPYRMQMLSSFAELKTILGDCHSADKVALSLNSFVISRG